MRSSVCLFVCCCVAEQTWHVCTSYRMTVVSRHNISKYSSFHQISFPSYHVHVKTFIKYRIFSFCILPSWFSFFFVSKMIKSIEKYWHLKMVILSFINVVVVRVYTALVGYLLNVDLFMWKKNMSACLFKLLMICFLWVEWLLASVVWKLWISVNMSYDYDTIFMNLSMSEKNWLNLPFLLQHIQILTFLLWIWLLHFSLEFYGHFWKLLISLRQCWKEFWEFFTIFKIYACVFVLQFWKAFEIVENFMEYFSAFDFWF